MLLVEVNHDTLRAEEAPKGWVCPKCDTPVSPSAKSCPKCTKAEVQEGVTEVKHTYINVDPQTVCLLFYCLVRHMHHHLF